jgi:hypothetical protein
MYYPYEANRFKRANPKWLRTYLVHPSESNPEYSNSEIVDTSRKISISSSQVLKVDSALKPHEECFDKEIYNINTILSKGSLKELDSASDAVIQKKPVTLSDIKRLVSVTHYSDCLPQRQKSGILNSIELLNSNSQLLRSDNYDLSIFNYQSIAGKEESKKEACTDSQEKKHKTRRNLLRNEEGNDYAALLAVLAEVPILDIFGELEDLVLNDQVES